jgi:hypothetical protein
MHRRHRPSEFRKFLHTIDTALPADLAVHLILDNYATPQDANDSPLAGPPSPVPSSLHADQ